jgi:hypothetical protein
MEGNKVPVRGIFSYGNKIESFARASEQKTAFLIQVLAMWQAKTKWRRFMLLARYSLKLFIPELDEKKTKWRRFMLLSSYSLELFIPAELDKKKTKWRRVIWRKQNGGVS